MKTINELLLSAATLVLAASACTPSENNNNVTARQTASLADVSGIPYSETTVNKKEGKRVLVISSSPRRTLCRISTELIIKAN